MSQISTLRNDTLVLYFLSTTATAPGVHFVEGIVHELSVVDGVAEGLGLGWIFQKTQGNTPADIYFAANVSDVGIRSTIQIPPPSTGATVIPSYTVSDSSIYLNPNGGTAAWDGATQMANTADTRFGTTFTVVGGNITGNDATVALATDIGINSFHAFQGLTNAATVGQISGAQVVMPAARYNVGNRNILAHFRHPTPANNQRLSSLASRRGVWMGMGSGPTNAVNYKVWQVHGVDVPLNAGYIRPIIINAANTDTIASNGNITNTDVRNYGFWTGGAGNLTQQTCIGPMWAMDTQVIAGGNATAPITLPEIVATCATAKERVSSLLQGANQMLCLQAIQFGDAATNSIYLDLENTAIEFPSLKNFNKKQVNYNGIANSVGLTYAGIAGDTVIHKNSVITSESPYHWRIASAATSAAVWDFTGLSIIGAGDVVLRPVVAFNRMTFTNCATITQNSSTISNCTISNSLIISTNLSTITDNTFTSGASGHAIQITTLGADSEFDLTNNSFTGYSGTTGTNTVPNSGSTNAAIYNNSGRTVTLNVSGGLPPSVRNGANSSTIIVTSAQVTITGIQPGSEIRAYVGTDPQTSVEVAGIESTVDVDPEDATKTIFSFNQGVGGQSGYITIIIFGYNPVYLPIVYSTSNVEIPIQQTVDRVASNP
jgi:hypothetical protein